MEMAAVLGLGRPIGALQRRHSLNRDTTGLAKCPPGKQISSHWIAIILFNKMDFSLCANMEGFHKSSHIGIYQ